MRPEVGYAGNSCQTEYQQKLLATLAAIGGEKTVSCFKRALPGEYHYGGGWNLLEAIMDFGGVELIPSVSAYREEVCGCYRKATNPQEGLTMYTPCNAGGGVEEHLRAIEMGGPQ